MAAPLGFPANRPSGIRVKNESAETKFLMEFTFKCLRRNEGGYLLLECSKQGTKKPRPEGRGFSKTHSLSVREELMMHFRQGLLASGSSYSPHLPI